ncbi:MAG: putative Se/S carrier-like protein [Eubacteriales bacterium]
MQLCTISQSSITYAVKARDALADAALPSRIVKLDPSRTRRGCAYGLEIDCRMVNSAVGILDRRGISYSEIVGAQS